MTQISKLDQSEDFSLRVGWDVFNRETPFCYVLTGKSGEENWDLFFSSFLDKIIFKMYNTRTWIYVYSMKGVLPLS